MQIKLKNADIYINGSFRRGDALFGEGSAEFSFYDGKCLSDSADCIIIPALTDVHTHLREPGFSYKETIKSGSKAALQSGYCAVCAMPNLNPVPDSAENLKVQTDIIKRDACTGVYPYGSITKGEKGLELADMEKMQDAVAFSDDGKGVQNPKLMEQAMIKAEKLGKIIAAHCEDNSLLFGGYIHNGEYARIHGHKGICSESEWKPIERDLQLAEKTGCKYHICHISAKESVALIRKAKERGVDVTCETGPHYLLFNDMCLEEDGRFKMNPPIRSEADRLALLEGIKDGTVDMIATDHAPHSAEEKSKGLEKSLMGITGLETAFPVLYTYLVEKNIITLEKLVELMSINPAKRFGIDNGNCYAVFDVKNEYKINSAEFVSMGKATPFEGLAVRGKCIMTVINGNILYDGIKREENR